MCDREDKRKGPSYFFLCVTQYDSKRLLGKKTFNGLSRAVLEDDTLAGIGPAPQQEVNGSGVAPLVRNVERSPHLTIVARHAVVDIVALTPFHLILILLRELQQQLNDGHVALLRGTIQRRLHAAVLVNEAAVDVNSAATIASPQERSNHLRSAILGGREEWRASLVVFGDEAIVEINAIDGKKELHDLGVPTLAGGVEGRLPRRIAPSEASVDVNAAHAKEKLNNIRMAAEGSQSKRGLGGLLTLKTLVDVDTAAKTEQRLHSRNVAAEARARKRGPRRRAVVKCVASMDANAVNGEEELGGLGVGLIQR